MPNQGFTAKEWLSLKHDPRSPASPGHCSPALDCHLGLWGTVTQIFVTHSGSLPAPSGLSCSPECRSAAWALPSGRVSRQQWVGLICMRLCLPSWPALVQVFLFLKTLACLITGDTWKLRFPPSSYRSLLVFLKEDQSPLILQASALILVGRLPSLIAFALHMLTA